jgi:hypothetical protein
MSAQVTIRLRFADIQERDEFIDTHFPERACMQTPGLFRIPSWGCVSVFLERVTLFPYKRKAKEVGICID